MLLVSPITESPKGTLNVEQLEDVCAMALSDDVCVTLRDYLFSNHMTHQNMMIQVIKWPARSRSSLRGVT